MDKKYDKDLGYKIKRVGKAFIVNIIILYQYSIIFPDKLEIDGISIVLFIVILNSLVSLVISFICDNTLDSLFNLLDNVVLQIILTILYVVVRYALGMLFFMLYDLIFISFNIFDIKTAVMLAILLDRAVISKLSKDSKDN